MNTEEMTMNKEEILRVGNIVFSANVTHLELILSLLLAMRIRRQMPWGYSHQSRKNSIVCELTDVFPCEKGFCSNSYFSFFFLVVMGTQGKRAASYLIQVLFLKKWEPTVRTENSVLMSWVHVNSSKITMSCFISECHSIGITYLVLTCWGHIKYIISPRQLKFNCSIKVSWWQKSHKVDINLIWMTTILDLPPGSSEITFFINSFWGNLTEEAHLNYSTVCSNLHKRGF